MQRNVGVIFGGISNENEISVITGTMALNVLKNGGEKVTPLYISQRGDIYTGEGLADIGNFKGEKYKTFSRAIIANGGIYVLNKRGKPKKFVTIDVCLNCCHGGLGEGGGVSGLFALYGIPFASANMFESAVFMDKYYTKLVLSALGVKVAPYVYIRNANNFKEGERLGFPLIIKPCKLGSSIGIELAENSRELQEGVEGAFFYDDGVIVETYLADRREINCAAYYSKGKVVLSECEEAKSEGDILSYDDKYRGGGKSILPADIPIEYSQKIKQITSEVYTKLNMRGIVRFDYILSGGEIYLSELNTVPGSLSYYLLSKGFKEFYPVLQAVILQALEDYKELKQKKIITTGILENLTLPLSRLGKK